MRPNPEVKRQKILRIIQENPGCSSGEISKILNTATSREVCHIISDLINQNLVTYVDGTATRRIRRYFPTEARK